MLAHLRVAAAWSHAHRVGHQRVEERLMPDREAHPRGVSSDLHQLLDGHRVAALLQHLHEYIPLN